MDRFVKFFLIEGALKTPEYQSGQEPRGGAMKVNDRVEDFSSVDQDGKTVWLSELLASGPLVLFFYPKAMTAG